MPDLRRMLRKAAIRIWFSRMTLRGAEHLPASGPVLYLSLHRNGIVDGFVQEVLLPAPTYMLSAQWTRGLLGLFFSGIPVVREKDAGDRSGNAAALEACVAHLRKGGELGVFPEGTSDLGPRHLPFKSGAARILAACLEEGIPVTALPVGLHYERAWAFRSRVEVVLGPPLDTRLPEEFSPPQRLGLLKDRMAEALEAVGVNVADAEAQRLTEALSYVATLGTELSYFEALKAFEGRIPEDLRQEWSRLEQALDARGAWRHQGVALVPLGPPWPYLLGFLLLAPVAGLALVANLPAVLAAYLAGRTLPDGPNVIALWRILLGMPALILWSALVAATAGATGHWSVFLAWALVTPLGLLAWYRVKKLAVALHNATRCRGLREAMAGLHARIVAFVREAR